MAPATKRSAPSSHHGSPKTPQKQARLSSFFTSPSSAGEREKKREEGEPPSHLSSSRSEDDNGCYDADAGTAQLRHWADRREQELADEEMARQLQRQWEAELQQDSEASAVKTERKGSNSPVHGAMPPAPVFGVAGPSSAIKKEDTSSFSAGGTGDGLGLALESERSSGADNKEQEPAPKKEFTADAVDFSALDACIAAVDLSSDIFQFNPEGVSTGAWPRKQVHGEPSSAPSAPFALLSHAFVLLSATRSRLAIVTILANLLRTLMRHDAEALLPAIYLVSNHIAPPYDSVELGLGGAIVSRAIRDVTGKSPKHLRLLWNRTGDPGDVAYEAKKDVKTLVGAPRPIEVTKLFTTLHTVARISGPGSANAKLSHVSRLLVASRGEETRFLVRIFHSHLRINAVRTTIATALARTFALDGPGSDETMMVRAADRQGLLANPTNQKQRNEPCRLQAMEKLQKAEKLVREVRARHPNFGSIVPALVSGGLAQLAERVPLRVGTPLSPMLGSITRSLADMFAKLGERAFVSEFKYDGQRVQIHAQHVRSDHADSSQQRALLTGGKGRWVGPDGDVYVRLFSRHLEDMTDKYPDIADLVPLLMGLDEKEARRSGNVTSFIMDAEVVATGLDGRLLPFQTLANRSRKDVELNNVKVAVGVFAFDLMQLNGNGLLKTSFRKRRELIHQKLPPCKPTDIRIARFDHVKSLESHDMDEVSDFFNQARQSKCEGIMVKSLDHHWEADPSGDATGNSSGRLELLADEASGDLVQENLDEKSSVPDATPATNRKGTKGAAAEIDIGKGVNGRGKALLSTYEPDKRCESWLKVKKDYIEGIGDSLDLVPIGGWHGMGRKAAWWSPVLLAVYDTENDEYQAVCKCISGFTDAEYKSIKFERFAEGSATCYDARTEACRHSFDTGGLLPDVWFEPCEVWEIRGADITLSPVYTAARGLVSMERGLSLRFPRFLRRRIDKAPADASRPQHLANLYLEQNASSNTAREYTRPPREPDSGHSLASEEEEEEEEEEEGAEHDGI